MCYTKSFRKWFNYDIRVSLTSNNVCSVLSNTMSFLVRIFHRDAYHTIQLYDWMILKWMTSESIFAYHSWYHYEIFKYIQIIRFRTRDKSRLLFLILTSYEKNSIRFSQWKKETNKISAWWWLSPRKSQLSASWDDEHDEISTQIFQQYS